MNRKIVIALVIAAACAGCRSVNVNEVPGGGPVTVWVDQRTFSSVDLSALTGMDTNTWSAIAQGAAAGATK